MAILNFSNTLDDIKKNGGIPSDLRLIFTGDKHIVTHGVDFLADYNENRGLVPTYPSNTGDYQVLGKKGWISLTNDHLPIDDNALPGTKLWTSQKIYEEIGKGFAANDAMVFKGVLDGETHLLPTGGYHAGWTYRVVKAGIYAKQTCEIGDLVIATADAVTDQSAINDNHWAVVQTNINGSSKVTINNIEYDLYTNGAPKTALTFVAPEKVGDAGQVLITGDKGKLGWVDQSVINAGSLGGTSKKDLLTEVSANNGVISVTVGGTTKTATAAGSWDITAANVTHSLKTSGDGLSSITYNGSSEQTITLLSATNTKLGGVIVSKPSNVEGNDDTISVNNGHIWLTKQNVINALGYTPENIKTSVPVSNKTNGLAPQILPLDNNTVIKEGYYLLGYNPNNLSEGEERKASWYRLPINVLGNTWRPIKVNGVELFNNTNNKDNVLNLKSGELIQLKGETNGTVTISTSAEVNQNAFSTINVNDTNISATSKTDTVTFTGKNVTIAGVAATKIINFSVADFAGATVTTAGQTGLTPAPAAGDNLKFLRGDGTWDIPTDTNTWRKIIVGDNSLGDTTDTGDLTITGGTDIGVSLKNNKITITSTYKPHTYKTGTGLASKPSDNETTFALKPATKSEIGGIQLGYTTSGKKYAVEVDTNNNAFVNVPWTDTNIRDIQIGGKSIGNDVKLNIVPSADVVVSWDTNENGGLDDKVATISFGLSWYNISESKYETMSIAK